MSFCQKFFRNQLGMSMVEMVIAGGLAGAAAMGVASMMKSMGGSAKDAETVVERTEFASALGVFLNSAKGCKAFQTTSFTSAPSQYTTPATWKFDGFNLFTNDKDLRYNHIKSLTAQITDVPGVKPITLKVDDTTTQTLKKSVIKFNLSVVEKSKNHDLVQKAAEEAKFPEMRWEYNVPVLANTANGAVTICGDNSTMAEACMALQGLYNESTGKCELPETCESFGSFSKLNCAPKFSGVSCNDTSHGTPVNNPVTGSQTCPVGVTAISTGGDTWYKTIDCGKKCTARVNFSLGFYTCLKCP
jgi:hypothetical protein